MKKKISFAIVMFSVILAFVHIYAYKIDNEKIINMGKVEEYEISKNTYDYYVDELKEESGNIIADGWIIKKGESLEYCDRRIVLISENEESVYGLNTVMKKRDSVTEFYHDGNYYSHSGVYASVDKKKLEAITGERNFRMGILVAEEDMSTRLVITNSEIVL